MREIAGMLLVVAMLSVVIVVGYKEALLAGHDPMEQKL